MRKTCAQMLKRYPPSLVKFFRQGNQTKEKTIEPITHMTQSTGGEITNRPTASHDIRWVQSDGWCSLCNRPFTSWGEHVMPSHHVGHRMLEMVYDTMVRSEIRIWSPRELLYGAMTKICLAKESTAENHVLPFHELFHIDNARHKREIHKALAQLAASGVFDGLFEMARLEGNTNLIKGSNLAPILVMKHLLVLFPGYDSGYLSEIIQLICSHNNFQDVFTLLGGVEIVQRFPVSKSFWESDYLRAILGELHNIIIERPRICKVGIELRSLAQYAFHAIIAELLLRVIENLVNQVDPVWRRQYTAPFMNAGLPKGHRLNRQSSNTTVSKPACKTELDSLQVNRFMHESWPSMVSSPGGQAAKCLPYARLGPHSYSTFRPRYAHFFKEDSCSTNAFHSG